MPKVPHIQEIGRVQLQGTSHEYHANQLAFSPNYGLLCCVMINKFLVAPIGLLLGSKFRKTSGKFLTFPLDSACTRVGTVTLFDTECFIFLCENDFVYFYPIESLAAGTPKCLLVLNNSEPVASNSHKGTWSFDFSSKNSLLILGSNKPCIDVYALSSSSEKWSTQKVLKLSQKHNVPDVKVSPCMQFFASVGIDRKVHVFDKSNEFQSPALESFLWSVKWVPLKRNPDRLCDYSLLVTGAYLIYTIAIIEKDGQPPLLAVKHCHEIGEMNGSRIYLQASVDDFRVVFYVIQPKQRLFMVRYDEEAEPQISILEDFHEQVVGLQAYSRDEVMHVVVLMKSGSLRAYEVDPFREKFKPITPEPTD